MQLHVLGGFREVSLHSLPSQAKHALVLLRTLSWIMDAKLQNSCTNEYKTIGFHLMRCELKELES